MFHAGQQLDRFVLVSLAGEGGQGSVWKAYDATRPGSYFALKLIPLAHGVDASRHVERLRREAQALSRLSHPSLVRCYGLFEDYAHGVLGLVLDWVEGQPLDRAASDPRMTIEHRLFLLRSLVFALSRLHSEGLVHRDVKLANVLVADGFYAAPNEAELVKLVDLGVVVPVSNPKPLTELGNVVGTVAYMAPELADATYERALSANPAADVFAFGVLGWRLLTGEHPTGLGFNADFMEYFLAYRAALVGETPWPAAGEVPGLWGGLLRSCLSLTLEQRPATAQDLAETVEGATLRMPPASTILRPSSELSVGYILPAAGKATTGRRPSSGTQPLAAHPGRPSSVSQSSVSPSSVSPSPAGPSQPEPPSSVGFAPHAPLSHLPQVAPTSAAVPQPGPMLVDETINEPAKRGGGWVLPMAVGILVGLLVAGASLFYLLR